MYEQKTNIITKQTQLPFFTLTALVIKNNMTIRILTKGVCDKSIIFSRVTFFQIVTLWLTFCNGVFSFIKINTNLYKKLCGEV